jgi:hypothetical protein
VRSEAQSEDVEVPPGYLFIKTDIARLQTQLLKTQSFSDSLSVCNFENSGAAEVAIVTGSPNCAPYD